jgi:molybdopterin/thiamine biosynthesis adenylyltransferase
LRDELLYPDEQERFAFLYTGTEGGDLLAHRVQAVPGDAMARQSKTACRPAPAVEREHVSACYDQALVPVLAHSHPFSADPRFSSIDVESMGRFREWLTGLFPDAEFGFAVVGTEGIEAVVNDGTDRLRALEVEVIAEWKLDDPVPDARSRFAVDRRPPRSGSRDEEQVDNADGVVDKAATETADETGRGNREARRSDGGTGSGTDDDRDPSDPGCAKRFDRNVRAFGVEGQRRLADATVGIVGVGGLGSIVAEQLARQGVTEFVLVDPDIVEKSNLSRVVGAYDHHVGKPKVTAFREHLWRSGADDVEVETHQERVQDVPQVLDRCDVIVGCVDSMTARSFCNEYAVKHLTYYVDTGVRIDTTDDQGVEMTGYVHLVAPGSNACFDCLGRHDQDAARIEQLSPAEREAERARGYIDEEDLAPEPAVIHLNGSCASKAVSVLTDLVTSRSAPPDFIRYEDTTNEMTELTTEPSDTCPTCGEDGVLGVGRRQFGDARFEPDEDQETAVSD